jgi:hypothetical protein
VKGRTCAELSCLRSVCVCCAVAELFTPSVPLAFVVAFLLGVGDAAINTVVYTTLGRLFHEGDADAFALYFFTRAAGACVAFAYSGERVWLGSCHVGY